MRSIRIMTDSCTDLPAGLLKENDVDVIRFSTFHDGREKLCSPDVNSNSIKQMYKLLRDGERIYTLPATEAEIRRHFQEAARHDCDILYIACPEKLSTTVVKARRVAAEILKDHPEAKIVVLDSLNASVGEGLLVLAACRMRDNGLSLEEIAAQVEQLANHVIEYVVPDRLIYLSKANKIQGSSAFMGDLMKVKPILIADRAGAQVAFTTVRGAEPCIDKVVSLLAENIVDPEKQTLYIIHSDAADAALALKEKIDKLELGFAQVEFVYLGPIAGISVGPGAVGVFAFGKEVTFLGD